MARLGMPQKRRKGTTSNGITKESHKSLQRIRIQANPAPLHEPLPIARPGAAPARYRAEIW